MTFDELNNTDFESLLDKAFPGTPLPPRPEIHPLPPINSKSITDSNNRQINTLTEERMLNICDQIVYLTAKYAIQHNISEGKLSVEAPFKIDTINFCTIKSGVMEKFQEFLQIKEIVFKRTVSTNENVYNYTFEIKNNKQHSQFLPNEILFLQCASYWFYRCYEIACKRGYIKKTDNVFIAGGALNRFYTNILENDNAKIGDNIGDVDFWFQEKKDAVCFQESWSPNSGTVIDMNKNLDEKMQTYDTKSGVYTTDVGLDPMFGMKFQFIYFTYFEPERIKDEFDFLHCTPFWASDDKTLYIEPNAWSAIKDKVLIYLHGNISTVRIQKYKDLGFILQDEMVF